MDSGGFRGRWRCAGCGETILVDYTQCWKCGAVRGAEGERGPEAGAQPLLAVDPPEAVRPPSLLGMTPVFAPAAKGLWVEVAVVFLVAILPPLVFAAWDFFEPQGKTSGSEEPFYDAVSLVVRSAAVSAAVLYIMARSGSPWSHFGIVKPKLIMDGILILLLLILQKGIRFFCWPVLQVLFREPDFTLPEPAALGVMGHIFTVVSDTANGFAEELVMRGYLVPRFETLFGSTGWAMLWSSVLFGAYHLYQGTASCFHMMLVGILYASAFAATRRLWPLALAHAVWNIILGW